MARELASCVRGEYELYGSLASVCDTSGSACDRRSLISSLLGLRARGDLTSSVERPGSGGRVFDRNAGRFIKSDGLSVSASCELTRPPSSLSLRRIDGCVGGANNS